MSPATFKTAMITGATSYLGRALAARLMESGVAVHAVVRPTSDLGRLVGLPAAPILHRYDGAPAMLAEAMSRARPEVIFHLAGNYVADHAPEHVETLVRDNILLGTQVLEASRLAGIDRFINTGSYAQNYNSSGYRPLNLYAATKQAFEDVMAYYADAHGMGTTTLRLYYTYGPGDWRGKLMEAIRQAQISGAPLPLVPAEEALNIVYVSDVVTAFVRAADLLALAPEPVRGGVFAVRPEKPVTVGEVVTAFESVGGRPVKTEWGAYPLPKRRITKPWRGPLLPGWRAEVLLADGIRHLIAGES